MDKLNTPMGEAITKTTLLGGAFVGLAGMLKAVGLVDKFKDMGEAFSYFTKDAGSVMLGTGIDKISDVFKFAGAGIQEAVYGFTKLLPGVKGMVPSLSAVGIGFGAITAAIIGTTYAINKMYDGYDDAVDKVNELTDARDKEFGADSRYQQLVSQQSQLNDLQKQELDFLQSKLDIQNQLIKSAQQEAYNEWEKFHGSGREVKFQGETLTADQGTLAAMIQSVANTQTAIESGKMSLDDFNSSFAKFLEYQQDAIEPLEKFAEQGIDISDAEQKQIDLVNNLVQAYGSGTNAIERYGAVVYETWLNAGSSSEDAKNKAEEAMSAAAEQQKEQISQAQSQIEATKASAKAVEDKDYTIFYKVDIEKKDPPELEGTVKYTADFSGISKTGPSLTGSGTPGAGYAGGPTAHAEGTTNSPGGPTLVNELGPELISANGRAWIAGGGKPTITNLPKGAIVLTADETKNALSRNGNGGSIPAFGGGTPTGKIYFGKSPSSSKLPNVNMYGDYLDQYITGRTNRGKGLPGDKFFWNPLDRYKPTDKEQDAKKPGPHKPTKSSGGSATPSGPSEEDLKEQTKQFKEQVKLMEHKLFLMEKEGKSDEELVLHQIDLLFKEFGLLFEFSLGRTRRSRSSTT